MFTGLRVLNGADRGGYSPAMTNGAFAGPERHEGAARVQAAG